MTKKTKLTHEHRTLSLKEWASQLGIPVQTLHSRRSNKWTPAQVLGFEPPPGGKAPYRRDSRAKPPSTPAS